MSTEVVADDLALRMGRRERALAQMAADDLDILCSAARRTSVTSRGLRSSG